MTILGASLACPGYRYPVINAALQLRRRDTPDVVVNSEAHMRGLGAAAAPDARRAGVRAELVRSRS